MALEMRRPGIEPGPPAWKAGILTTELSTLAPVDLKTKILKWFLRQKVLCVHFVFQAPPQVMIILAENIFTFQQEKESTNKSFEFWFSSSYGHTILDTPDPIRTPKLSRIGPT